MSNELDFLSRRVAAGKLSRRDFLGRAAALGGFVLFGFGASHPVPVWLWRASQQAIMPAAITALAVTTASVGGVLLRPALFGFTAMGVGLSTAFWLLAGLVTRLPLAARRVTR